jgi:hypothetical protein
MARLLSLDNPHRPAVLLAPGFERKAAFAVTVTS